MATNGKNDGNNMTPNMSFTDNSSNEPQKGIFGYLENRGTRGRFAKDYWKEDSGYLDTALKDLKEMQKLYKELEKSQDKMNTSQENQFKSQKRALELQIATLEDIKQTQDVNDRDALRSITDSNKLRNKGLLEYQKLLDNIAKRQETLKSGDKELAAQLREDAEYINELYASMNKEIQQQNLNIEVTGEKLKNNTSSFSKAMSETLKSASDELKGLLDTFNLNKLANSGLNQFLTDKIAIQNDMMKQFGFETKSQYLSFKDGLDESLASMNRDMGNIFSGKDLTNYMQNMSSLGITNTKMAQDQMRASIMGSKYLGVSAETQQEMFKWMKRTNSYEMLDEHNKTITGLLKSDLGVSKEQLDALTQIAYGSMEDKSALGMSNEAIQAQAEASDIMGAVLTNMYDENTAKAVQSALNDFILNPGDTKWVGTFGGQYQGLYNSLFNSGTKEGQLDAMYKFLEGIQKSGVLNVTNGGQGLFTAIGNKKTNELTALDNTVISALQKFDNSKYLELQQDALDGILKSNTEEFIEETTEVTLLEKIYNKIDEFFTSIDSAHLVSLANTYFALWAGSNIFSVISKFGDLGLPKSLAKSSKVVEETLSEGGGLLSSSGGVLLSAVAISALASAYSKSLVHNKSSISNDELTYAKNKLNEKGLSNLANNTNYATSYAESIADASSASLGNTVISSLGGPIDVISKWFSSATGNYLDYNSKIWDNFASRGLSGLSVDEVQAMRIMYAILLNEVGYSNLAKTKFGLTKSDISDYINSTKDSDVMLKKSFENFKLATKLIFGVSMPKNPSGENFDGNFSLDGYHKAGLNRVPKENYKALLHKDEMVLNKRDANILRNALKFGLGGESDNTDISTDSPSSYPNKKYDTYFNSWPWPLTAGYPRYPSSRKQHRGLDFGIPVGTKLGAVVDGVIERVDSSTTANTYPNGARSFGQYILLHGNDGIYYRYGHLSQIGVTAGQEVTAGETIGLSGNSGYSSGPHLHFQVQTGIDNKSDINPYSYVKAPLFQATGELAQVNISSTPGGSSGYSSNGTNSDGTTSSTKSSKFVPISTGRFLPSSLASKGGIGGGNDGIGGADKVVHSVDGGFSRLLNYLDNIRSEQSAQREMLNAFSRLNSENNTI